MSTPESVTDLTLRALNDDGSVRDPEAYAQLLATASAAAAVVHTAWCTDHDDFTGACQSDIYSVREAIGVDQLGPSTTVQLGQMPDDTPRVEINLATPTLGLSATLQLAQVLGDLARLALRTYINEEAAK